MKIDKYFESLRIMDKNKYATLHNNSCILWLWFILLLSIVLVLVIAKEESKTIINILGFEIERRRESEEQFKKISDVGPNETRYTDTGLMPGAIYYYRIRAYGPTSKSEYTKEIRVKISDK